MTKNVPMVFQKSTIQKLYPQLSLEEQEEAAYYLKRYFNALWDIFLNSQGKNRNLTDPTSLP